MEMRDYKKGEVIFKQHTYGTELYEIYGGEVGIYAKYGEPGEKLLTKLGPERYFGEMGLVEARPRSATAVALEPCRLAVVSSETFSAYIKERPDKILEIMSSMSVRLRELTGDYMDACRTIAAIEAGGTRPKENWLVTNIKKFAAAYNESMEVYNDALCNGTITGAGLSVGTDFYPMPF